MASVNKVILVGALGRDPETRYATSGDAICNFSMATSESWKDKASGEKKEKTEWHRISSFGKLAEICGEYLKKGSQVYVEGKLQTRKWQDKEGIDRYSTEIIVDRMQMLGGKPSGESAPKDQPAANKSGKGGGSTFDEMSDDIPFITASACNDVIWRKLRLPQ